jgi:hypothetical protein
LRPSSPMRRKEMKRAIASRGWRKMAHSTSRGNEAY